jgi:hypothetical protein
MLCNLRAALGLVTSGLLIFAPILARFSHAGSPRQVVIIPVYEHPSKDLDRLRDRLEAQLIQEKNIAIVPVSRVRGFFFQGDDTATPVPKTAGDNLYIEAREYFYNGRFAEAKASVHEAIAKLKEKPGMIGNLVRALLLKTQIAWELRDPDMALAATKEAVAYNFDFDTLDPTENPGKLREFYRKVHQQCVKEYGELVDGVFEMAIQAQIDQVPTPPSCLFLSAIFGLWVCSK